LAIVIHCQAGIVVLQGWMQFNIVFVRQVQTEDEIQEDIQLYEDDSPELAAFLLKMEPLVAKELQKNKRSHAFDGTLAGCGCLHFHFSVPKSTALRLVTSP
jgi:hypothetical protein